MSSRAILCCLMFELGVITSAFGQFTPDAGPAGPNDNTFTAEEEFRTVTPQGNQKFMMAPAPTAPANPTSGPDEIYLYKNALGKFKLPAADQLGNINTGTADYVWQGQPQHDMLSYLAHGYVTDNEGYFVKKGSKVSVWAFLAEDVKGNHWFLYFGTEPFRAPQGLRYPMYYSWGAPGPTTAVKRIITSTGTSRE
jgi:hypothetical protein